MGLTDFRNVGGDPFFHHKKRRCPKTEIGAGVAHHTINGEYEKWGFPLMKCSGFFGSAGNFETLGQIGNASDAQFEI